MNPKTEHLSITGMSCEHCVKAVDKAIKDLSGVITAKVSVGKAEVHYDPALTSRDKMVEAVEEAGYSVY